MNLPTWRVKEAVDWNAVRERDSKIPHVFPIGFTLYGNPVLWGITNKESRKADLEAYLKLYGTHKKEIDEVMNMVYSDLPPDWFTVTEAIAREITGVKNV